MYEDYIPTDQAVKLLDPKHAQEELALRHMTKTEMESHRETESYKKFKNGWFPKFANALVSPFVRNAHVAPPEDINVPPWADNLLRHQIRGFVRPFCYFGGVYELLFDAKVQIFYDCQTWMDMDFLAFQV